MNCEVFCGNLVVPNLRNLGQERLVLYVQNCDTVYMEMQTGFQFQVEIAWRKKNGTVLSVRNRSYVLADLLVCMNVMELSVFYLMQ